MVFQCICRYVVGMWTF